MIDLYLIPNLKAELASAQRNAELQLEQMKKNTWTEPMPKYEVSATEATDYGRMQGMSALRWMAWMNGMLWLLQVEGIEIELAKHDPDFEYDEALWHERMMAMPTEWIEEQEAWLENILKDLKWI